MEEALRTALLAPPVVLSLLVGAFHTCLYIVLRGRAGRELLLVLPAAIAGAWAGQALAARLGDALRLGDYGLLWASLLAWLGIVVVSVSMRVRATTGGDGNQGGASRPPGP
jgi:hypothetical protein